MEKNILIIDDDDAFLYIINRLIKKTHPNYNITIFDNSSSGASFLIEKSPVIDLVFLDLNMPFMNGVELLEKLFKTNKLKKPSIIVTSSSDLSKEKMQFSKFECIKGFLVKPIDNEKIEWALGLIK